MRAEFPKAIVNVSSVPISHQVEAAHWASSQVTMGDKPILYMRVKKAKKVKTRGARTNSYSSRVFRIEGWGCRVFFSSGSSEECFVRTAPLLPSLLPGTFLLRTSWPSSPAPVVYAPCLVAIMYSWFRERVGVNLDGSLEPIGLQQVRGPWSDKSEGVDDSGSDQLMIKVEAKTLAMIEMVVWVEEL